MIPVSVIVAARNEEHRIAGCLEALSRQTYPPEDYEVIVVDGLSVDGTARIASRYPVKFVSDDGPGAARARNRGALAATGDVLAFTDADCIPARDWLERLGRRLRADPGLAGIGGGLRHHRRTLFARHEDDESRALYSGFITSNVAYRREAFLAVGGFTPDLLCAEDWDLAWRLLEAGHRLEVLRSAVVTHDPVENDTAQAYFRKQLWYAANDVPAFALAAARAGGGPAGALRSPARAHVLDAAARAAAAGLTVAGAAFASPPVVAAGAAILLGDAAARTAAARPALGPGLGATARFAGLSFAKGLVRGLGTLEGLLARTRERVIRSAGRAAPARGTAVPSAAPATGRAAGAPSG